MKRSYLSFLSVVIIMSFFLIACNSKKDEVKNVEAGNKPGTRVEKTVLISNVDSLKNQIVFRVDEVNISKDEANVPAVVNDKEEIINYPVSDSVEIYMQTFDYDDDGNYKVNQQIILEQLTAALNREERYKFIPFDIVVKGDEIVKITEKYIP